MHTKKSYLEAVRYWRRLPSDGLNNKMEDHPIGTLNSLCSLFYYFIKDSPYIQYIDDTKEFG